MRRSILTSLRSRLLLLVLVAGVPSLGLIVYNGLEQRGHATEMVQDEMLRLARLVAVEQEQVVSSTRELLIVQSQTAEVRNFDSAECNKRFAELLRKNPAYANIGAVRTNGMMYASGLVFTNGLNIDDRPYFQRALATRDFAMGDYQVGRATGKPTINFGYPVLDDDGQPQGVVFAAIDLSWLNKLAKRVNLPRGGSLMVIDRSGTVLVCYPDSDKYAGHKFPEVPIVKTVLEQRGGTATAEGNDGVERLYGFTRMSRLPAADVYVAVGVPVARAQSEAKRLMINNLALLAVVVVLALAAAWIGVDFFILRRVRMLAGATRKVAGGDLGARTNLSEAQGELGQLGQAFDEMTVALEQRETDRQHAVDALRRLNEELEQRVVARTSELREKNDQMQSDLKMAREIQLAFLPQKYPTFPRDAGSEQSALQFCHRYLPTGSIGGDFFAVLSLSDSEAGVFICDVMGHGVRAALVTATLRGLIEELSPVASDPNLFLAEMNHALLATLRRVNTTMFASAFYLVADVAAGQIRFANAGHPGPVHIRRNGSLVEPLGTNYKAGPALGLFENSVYPINRRPIAADDLLILYTDGLYEVHDETGQQYGEERLWSALRKRIHLPCARIFDEILEEIRRFSHTNAFGDDVCLVGMDVTRVGVEQKSKTADEGAPARL